jgi:hypothetical protein
MLVFCPTAHAVIMDLSSADINEAVSAGAKYRDSDPISFMNDLCAYQEIKADYYDVSVVLWTKYSLTAFDSFLSAKRYQDFNLERLEMSSGYRMLEDDIIFYVLITSQHKDHLDDFKAVLKQGNKVFMTDVAVMKSLSDKQPDGLYYAVYHWGFPLKDIDLKSKAALTIIPLMGKEQAVEFDLYNIK